MGIKGCWTCRERKVRCDTQQPKCGNCMKARRICKGYGIQLSWPRESDRRRAKILRDVRQAFNKPRSGVTRLLNTSSWDMLLSAELENGRISANQLRRMRVPRLTYLSPAVINHEESHLLEFFNESRSLVLGPTDNDSLASFILKIAFSNPSDATNPVLQGVFALASLQLHGDNKSFRYKHLVISSVKDPNNEENLLQYLVAMMLLYHYELTLGTNSQDSWEVFLCSVKRVINTSPAMQKLLRQEYSAFLDWIYYHEVIAEFTVRHWKVPYDGCGFAPIARAPRVIEDSASNVRVDNSIGCPTDVLQLIVQACRQALTAEPPEMNYAKAGLECIEVLEHNIYSVVGEHGPVYIEPATTQTDRRTMVAGLHRLACLIYVNRAVHGVSGTEFRHRRLVKEAVLLLSRMVTCQNAWPLFIIACEAVDDDQRLAILDVFEQTRQNRRRRSSHIHFIQHRVETMWKQLDLNAEKEIPLDYMTIFDAVVRLVPFLPPFA